MPETTQAELQFQTYIHQIKQVLATSTVKADQSSSQSKDLPCPSETLISHVFPSEKFENKFRTRSTVVPLPAAENEAVELPGLPPPDCLSHLRIPYHSAESRNLKDFQKDFDKLQLQLKETTSQNSVLSKDKAYLIGRNEYLEKSNQDISMRLTAVSEQVSNLQQNREDLLRNAHIVHEKDRTHYLQSFQKVLKNFDAEKMKDLNRGVRHQLLAYESQIADLKASSAALIDEGLSTRKEMEKLQQKLGAAELALATNTTGQSQAHTDLQLTLLARTYELQQTKASLESAMENTQRLKSQCGFLEDKSRIILQEHERLKRNFDDEKHQLQSSLTWKDSKLEAYENLSENEVRNLKLSFAVDRRLVEKDNIIDQLLRKVSEMEADLREKRLIPTSLAVSTAIGSSEELKDLSAIVRQQNLDLARLKGDVGKLTAELRMERETLEKVRKTRDELYEVVSSDPRYRNEFRSTHAA